MIRRFARCERAATALEAALALSVLVVAFALLMNIVGDVYAEDRGQRGAQAVARTLALDPSADPWAVLRRELGLDETHNCAELIGNAPGACDGWTLSVAAGVAPASLETAIRGTAASDGDMVLVRLWRDQGGNDSTPDSIGLARGEPEG